MTQAQVRLPAGGATSLDAGWNRALSANEIVMLQRGGAYDQLVMALNPIAYWWLTPEVPVTFLAYDSQVSADSPAAYWPLNQELP